MKTKEAFDQNLDKFRIYAMRNIFSPSTQSESAASNGSSSIKTDEQLQQLRHRYLSLQAENRALADSCRDAEVLLKDMRSAMFTLKVGAQAFDNGTIENVADMTAVLKLNEAALESLIAEANGAQSGVYCLTLNVTHSFSLCVACAFVGIVASLTEYSAPVDAAEGAGGAMDVAQEISSAAIETKDAEDITALAKSLRRK